MYPFAVAFAGAFVRQPVLFLTLLRAVKLALALAASLEGRHGEALMAASAHPLFMIGTLFFVQRASGIRHRHRGCRVCVAQQAPRENPRQR